MDKGTLKRGHGGAVDKRYFPLIRGSIQTIQEPGKGAKN